ncbi:hypothetical protein M422DRAFT_270239 [Sphaerobolus stellatus SS14]|uniref:Uncharacterized protein n=1 Tax=Sphaerobolus stellatus (strain SS14) TaxID=990650 RepID=A0A0C9U2U0_SPHS4|nr:hypothetical protein M422DRAFT_270239 [Sphaerobolus stellatus SS14]
MALTGTSTQAKWCDDTIDTPQADESEDELVFNQIPLSPKIYTPQLAIKPRFTRYVLGMILKKFKIKKVQFIEAVKCYEIKHKLLGRASGRGWTYVVENMLSIYNVIDVRTLFCIKLPVLDDLHDPVETQILRADPGDSQKKPACDVVFINMEPDKDDIQVGSKFRLRVSQIKLIFQPYISPEAAKRHNPRPHLALVKWFKVKPQADPDINMFMASK